MTGSLLRLTNRRTWVNSLVIVAQLRAMYLLSLLLLKEGWQPPFVFRSEGLEQCYQTGTFPDPYI